MSGIALPLGDQEIRMPTIWVDPDDQPVVFLVMREGSVCLASADYVADVLDVVDQGDLDPEDAWDHLLIKTPGLEYPQRCTVHLNPDRRAQFRVDGALVHEMEI